MAGLVRLEKFGRVYVMTLVGGGEHRLAEPLFEAVLQALHTVRTADDAGALVTVNEGKFFSNGLDMDWVRSRLARGPGAAGENSFNRLLAALVDINVPTVAAICGHAAAGGFILALAHDHRCMRRDRGYLYMSELDVQVRLAGPAMAVVRNALAPKVFKDTVLPARKQTADNALAAGIVDSAHDSAAETLQAAIAWATQLSDRGWNRDFYRTMRLDMRPGLLKELVDGIDGSSTYPQHPTLSKL